MLLEIEQGAGERKILRCKVGFAEEIPAGLSQDVLNAISAAIKARAFEFEAEIKSVVHGQRGPVV